MSGLSDSSTIEWTDATWNPVTGCTRVSPAGRRFARVGNAETTGVQLHADRLERTPPFRMSQLSLFAQDVA